MTRALLLPGLAFACALGIASAASAEIAPASMGADARVRSVLYNPLDVIRLDTHLRVNTAIELGAGERIAPPRRPQQPRTRRKRQGGEHPRPDAGPRHKVGSAAAERLVRAHRPETGARRNG